MTTASKTSQEDFLVFALSPCSVLDDAIRKAKAKTLAIAGDQTYLSHPPHLTLYVSAFDSRENVIERCAQLAAKWTPPKLTITGWHYFSGDVLTGNQTLVCEIAEECKTALRNYQRALIEEISCQRCVVASSNRYRPHFSALSQVRQQAVERVGFPFVDGDWIPHLTIASIDPNRWSEVWNALRTEPPIGHFFCPKLTLFELQDGNPRAYCEWNLVG